ncbi:MAG TPA: alpha/beta hydrolase [Actinomycetota bacterium]|nr:alpha/beta hydrolase [Actinomycetota bacterium]
MEQVAELSSATLAYEIVGSGPPLVWCHGLASCREGDRDVIDAFARHFTVLGYDARGHGRSAPARIEEDFTYPQLSRDLRELLEHVGWDRAILTGASMGAATAVRVAMEDPKRAAALVMVRPGSDGGPAPQHLQMLFRLGASAIRSGGLDAAIDFLMTIPEARAAIEKDPKRLAQLREDWGRHDPLSIAAALEGIPASPPLSGEIDPRDILAPALVIPGNDPIHSLEAGMAVAALIPTARAAEPLEAVSREEETERLLEIVLAFLREHLLD